MTTDEIHQLLVAEFGSEAVLDCVTDVLDPWIVIAADAVPQVCEFLKSDERLQLHHLNDLTAVDYFEPDEKERELFKHDPHIEVVYHLTSYTTRLRLVIKVMLPRWKDDEPGQLPEVPSVSSIWAIANWHERECYDLCGVHFTNHPNLHRILTTEDWVGHPLRKDYEFPEEYHGIRCM
ncbi:NADH-quinone oxidoreductase subunit C [Calycomorphotria hydatis]|uniref:NADH-quinone oxidoreductase subunit C n=1 Tax=Calycomorphotria hydatis TaxID=2528027 RepID=A0A517T805_9PLAN|nr:NADH-quinone oxidoreductase subunit C [Calycomorphotria hydatis]QDT64497.1 NAD(P)H-quinone oxidoreductase subunit J [Calycomorphotria hydatis]